DRVAIANRHEFPPLGPELDERRGAPEPAVGELAVDECQGALLGDVGSVACIVDERGLMRPDDARVETAPARFRMRLARESELVDLALVDAVAPDAHAVVEVDVG